MASIYYVLTIFLILLYFENTSSKNLETLKLVHVLFRHGDRTPDWYSIYPKDPHINETYFPYGYGQLTNEGKRTEYAIGKALRKRYKEFLGKYSPITIDARSTSYNRTKMSLQLVLASLFPPENEEIWQQGFIWQPIPFNYLEQKNDQLLAFPKNVCPNFLNAYDSYLKTNEGKLKMNKYNELFKNLSSYTGWNVNTTHELSELYLTLIAQKDWGFELPNWAPYGEHLMDLLKKAAIEEYLIRTSTSKMKRLSAGFLLKKIIEDSKSKIQNGGSKKTKIYLYSAHEYNIGSMLSTLNYNIQIVPPYGSYIIFELHKIKNTYGLKIFYQNYSSKKLISIKPPRCNRFCPLQKFEKIFKTLLPKSEKECF